MATTVEQEREAALARLKQMQAFYERPEAAQLLQQFQQRASGQDQPYSQQVQNSQLADNADSAAGQFRWEREQGARQFGNAGLSGSGLQMSNMYNSQRRASALARQGRNQITSRAALANYQAKTAAQQDVQSYLSQMNQAQMQAGQAEVDFRSQAREVTDAPAPAAAPAASPSGVTTNPKNGLTSNYFAPNPNSLQMVNTQNSYGGTATSQGGGFAPYWQAQGWSSPQQGALLRQFGF